MSNAIGSVGASTCGSSSGIGSDFSINSNSEDKKDKKVAYCNSIWQGQIPPDASAVRA